MVTTAGFVLAEVAALLFGGVALRVFVALSLAMFVVGCVAFLWAFAVGVSRSRYETIAVSTIYGLAGTETQGARLPLFGSIVVEVIAAVAGAAAKPFTPMAFGVLAPMFALGMTGVWGARYGGGSEAPRGPLDAGEAMPANHAPNQQEQQP